MPSAFDGRIHQPQLVAGLVRTDDGELAITSPAVGLWRGGPAPGAIVTGSTTIGEIEILGVLHRLRTPAGAHGLVVGEPDRRARRPVGHGEVLLVLDPKAVSAGAGIEEAQGNSAAAGLVFRAPSSGRFYRRPAPDKPELVREGDVIAAGQSVGLLEIMKTFHRVHYGGEGLPEPARVKAILVEDESDLEAGDAILEVEAVS